MRLKPAALVVPVLAAVVVLVVALALAKSNPQHPAAASASSSAVRSGHTTVKIDNFAYEPDTLTVKVGTRVTFHNFDMTAHTATAMNQAFDTGTIQPGRSKTIVVRRAGTYAYHCLFHEFMTGTLSVVR